MTAGDVVISPAVRVYNKKENSHRQALAPNGALRLNRQGSLTSRLDGYPVDLTSSPAGPKPAYDENCFGIKLHLRCIKYIASTILTKLLSHSERSYDTVVEIITFDLCFGPCTEVHKNSYRK